MDKELRNQQRVAALDPQEIRAQEQLAMSHWRAGRHMDAYKIFHQPSLGLESESAQALISEMVMMQQGALKACSPEWETVTIFESIFEKMTLGPTPEHRSVKDVIESGEVLTSLCLKRPCSDQEAQLVAQIPFLQVLEVRGQVGRGNLSCFKALKHLNSLAFWITESTGTFRELDQLTGLRQLSIVCNDFKPEFAAQVVKLPHLQHFNLSIDKGPSAGLIQLKNAPALKSMSLDSKRVDDSHISRLFSYAPLTELYLEEMVLSQESLNHISSQEQLNVLHLTKASGLNNCDLSCLSRLTGLRQICFEHCSILSYQLDFLSKLPKLTYLTLTGSNIDNGVIESISPLQQLEILDLSFSTISNRALRRLQKLSELKVFIAHGTTMTSDGIRHLIALPNLEKVQWQANNPGFQRDRDGSLTEFLDRIPPETEYFLPGAIGHSDP